MGYWNSIKSPDKVYCFSGNCQSPASYNTKGNYNQIAASTPTDGNLYLGINPAMYNTGFMVDIALGENGSERIVLENLYFCAQQSTVLFYPQFFNTGLLIPAGSRISARCQCNVYLSNYFDVICFIAPFGSEQPCQIAQTIGANTSSTKGITVDPGNVANTRGNWSQFSSGTERKTSYLIFMPGSNSNFNRQYAFFDLDIGLTSTPGDCIILEGFRIFQHTYMQPSQIVSVPINIPAGSEIHVRAACNITDAADRLFDAVIILLA